VAGGDGYDLLIEGFQNAAVQAGESWSALRCAEPLVRTPADRTHLAEELALTELIHRTFLSCAQVLAFLYVRRRWEQTGAEEDRRAMRDIAVAERENARSAAPIYAE